MKARIAKKRYKRLERTITEMHGQIRHLEWMAEREAAFRLPREGSFRRAGLDKSIDRREMRFTGMSEPPFLRIALVKRGDCIDRHLSVFSLVVDVDERERITPPTARFVEYSVLELLRGVWNRNYTPADEAKFEEELIRGRMAIEELKMLKAPFTPEEDSAE